MVKRPIAPLSDGGAFWWGEALSVSHSLDSSPEGGANASARETGALGRLLGGKCR